MGEIADMIVDQMIWGDPYDEMERQVMIEVTSYDTWIMGAGDTIKVCDMEFTHIQNCINMIERKDNWRKDWLQPLRDELTRRNGDINYDIWNSKE